MLDALYRWERRIAALPMPSPLVWIVLVAGCLGFGVLLGRATGPNSPAALAARRAPLKLLVAETPSDAPASSQEATPPPVPSSEPTPEPPSAGAEGETNSEPSAGEQPQSSGQSKQSAPAQGSPEAKAAPKPQPIKHVFVVMLSDEPYATAFGPASPAHYLTGTLEHEGKLLVRYYAVAHEGLADSIALLSGQGPTEATAAGCPTYSDIVQTGTGADGQVLGQGCAYPAGTQTLPGQLTAKHLTWKAYIGGLDEGGAPRVVPCTAPSSPAGADVSGQYQASSNPFVYFHSILASRGCASREAGIEGLKGDLASQSRTANFSYIAPGPCEDGAPQPCAPGKPAGMSAANGFLQRVVPEILASKAYKHDGLLAITVEDAPSTGEFADSSSCCGQPHFANLPAPTGAAALSPPGGGQVGLLLLSARFKKKGGELVQDTYSHYSLLASIEQIFGLSRLGYAGLSEEKPFSASLLQDG